MISIFFLQNLDKLYFQKGRKKTGGDNPFPLNQSERTQRGSSGDTKDRTSSYDGD